MSDLIVLKNHPNLFGRARKTGDILKDIPGNASKALVESGFCAFYSAPTSKSEEGKIAVELEEQKQEATAARRGKAKTEKAD